MNSVKESHCAVISHAAPIARRTKPRAILPKLPGRRCCTSFNLQFAIPSTRNPKHEGSFAQRRRNRWQLTAEQVPPPRGISSHRGLEGWTRLPFPKSDIQFRKFLSDGTNLPRKASEFHKVSGVPIAVLSTPRSPLRRSNSPVQISS